MNTRITVLLTVCWFTCTVGYAVNSDHSWANKKAEVYFLVDSSASVWINDYRKMLKFLADIVADMDIGEDATRVGLGVYSARHQLYIPIDNQKSKANLEGAITEAPYLVGDTYISRALQGMREEGFAPDITRKGVPLIAVLLTDGMSRHKQLTLDNATMAKRQGIFLFTVGIGSHVDRKELLTIASDPKADYNMYVQDFDHFEDIRHSLSKKMSEVEYLQADKGTCGDQTLVDTVFVYDEAALGDDDTQKIQTFMRYLVEGFGMNSGNARVGVVSKTCREGDITLGQYVTKEDFSAGLDSNQGPDISSLFRHARQTAFLSEHGARLDALRRLVLIMHKPPESKLDILREILRAKFAGIQIFVIRLGTDYDKVFITRLASNPDHAMFFDSPDHLLRGKEAARRIFCERQ